MSLGEAPEAEISKEKIKELKVLIAGGGTGGHIMPALAICQALIVCGVSGANIEFLGSKSGQDKKLLEGTNFKLHELDNKPLNRKLNLELLSAIVSMLRSVIQGYKKVKSINPDVVVAVGGFASVPGILGAKLNSKPILQINLDKAPGLAVRFGSIFANIVADGFKDTGLKKSQFVGIPLRAEIVDTVDRRAVITEASALLIKSELGITGFNGSQLPGNGDRSDGTGDKTVVVMGGSLGAKALNDMVPELAARLNRADSLARCNLKQINVYHIAGNRGINEVEPPKEPVTGYTLKGFELKMDLLYQIADLIICRSGASTVAEILTIGIPSIMVPLPNAPRNHQYFNAITYEKQGACLVMEQKDLQVELLSDTIINLLADPAKMGEMSRKALSVGVKDAGHKIAKIIIRLAVRN